jgi:hypothetical protein
MVHMQVHPQCYKYAAPNNNVQPCNSDTAHKANLQSVYHGQMGANKQCVASQELHGQTPQACNSAQGPCN